MPAAEEQHCVTDHHALCFLRRALLHEAAKRCQSGAGADHDHRLACVLREAKTVRGGGAHEAVHRVAGFGARQKVGAHALEGAAARSRGRTHHAYRHAAACRIDFGRRRDGVVARRKRRQHFQIHRQRQLARRKLFQQVEHRFARHQYVALVMRCSGFVAARACAKGRLRDRAARVLGHGADLFARGDVLQFDIVAEQPLDRDHFIDRQERLTPGGGLEPNVRVARQAETLHRTLDLSRAVARHHAQMVAGAIADAFGQREFDVAGRAVGRHGAGLGLQLVVDDHAQRHSAKRFDQAAQLRRRQLFERVERFGLRCGRVGLDVEAGVENRPQCVGPVLECAVHVFPRIAFTARMNALGAELRQSLVDAPWHSLVGRCPVGIAASEYAVAHTVQRIVSRFDPPPEIDGVIRRGAVVRGADDCHRPVGWQALGVVVERREGGGKAAHFTGLRKLPCQVFCRAEVRAVQHQQRRAVPRTACRQRHRQRTRDFRCSSIRQRRAGAAAQGHRAARLDLDLEAFRLDRQRLFDLQLVVVVIDQFEALDHHAEREHRFLQGELPADAGALAVSERLEGVGRARALGLACEVVGVELVGVLAPDALVTMQRERMHDDHVLFVDRVFAADGRVLFRAHRDGRRRRIQPQRLLQDLQHVLQPVDLCIGRSCCEVGAENAVDLGLCLGHHVGVF